MKKTSAHISIEIARTINDLIRVSDDWDELARNAVESNAYYESGVFLAAVRHIAWNWRICCVFIFRNDATDARNPRRLVGFFPFQRSSKGPRGLIPCYQSFSHACCYLSTPLVHAKYVEVVLSTLLDWMDSAPDGVRLFGLYNITGDGILAQRLASYLAARRQPHFVESQFFRAFLQFHNKTRDYIAGALSAKKIKEYRRLLKRLGESGILSVKASSKDDNRATWATSFLELEARGWKGRSGNAMAKTGSTRKFFHEIINYFGNHNRAILQSIQLDDRPIAMKCSFISADGTGSFAFKIAYDEYFSRFSPGVLLELENIQYLQKCSGRPTWMDSCANPNHPMIDHLWRERRKIVFLLCGSRSIIGRVSVGLFRIRSWQLKKSREKKTG